MKSVKFSNTNHVVSGLESLSRMNRWNFKKIATKTIKYIDLLVAATLGQEIDEVKSTLEKLKKYRSPIYSFEDSLSLFPQDSEARLLGKEVFGYSILLRQALYSTKNGVSEEAYKRLQTERSPLERLKKVIENTNLK